MATRRVLDELWDAQHSMWEADDRRRTADDAVWQIIRRPHSDHEFLTAQLELAHAHMVIRDLTERAVLAVLDAPRPRGWDAGQARGVLGDLLSRYGSHRGALERIVGMVRDRQGERAKRPARHSASRAARVPPAVPAARSPGRSPV